jgi:hypothetical protein
MIKVFCVRGVPKCPICCDIVARLQATCKPRAYHGGRVGAVVARLQFMRAGWEIVKVEGKVIGVIAP